MNSLWEENIFTKTGSTFMRCKNCEAETRIYRPQSTVLFSCPKCHKIYSKENEEYNKLSVKKRQGFSPVLPLNCKGEMNGIIYTVVGFALKHEKNNAYAKWEEYVLLDEQGHYAFLNQNGGHWLLLKERQKPGEFEPKSNFFINDDLMVYDYYTSYYYLTDDLAGEFPYDAIDVKKTYIREYISPPYIFTSEQKGNTHIYFQGSYLRPGEVKKIFSDTDPTLPSREGIGSCQPFYFGINPRRFTILSLFLFLISLPLYIFMRDEVSNQALASLKTSSLDSSVQHVVSPSFEIRDRPAILRFDSYCSLDNNWAEADLALVNETTGKERSFSTGLEYYHGMDDEGAWHEGSESQTDYLGQVEPGRYHVEAVFSGSRGANYSNMQVLVYKDSSTPWNYWLCIGLLAAICCLVQFASHHFEKKRDENK
jgi:hypothetical protein